MILLSNTGPSFGLRRRLAAETAPGNFLQSLYHEFLLGEI